MCSLTLPLPLRAFPESSTLVGAPSLLCFTGSTAGTGWYAAIRASWGLVYCATQGCTSSSAIVARFAATWHCTAINVDMLRGSYLKVWAWHKWLFCELLKACCKAAGKLRLCSGQCNNVGLFDTSEDRVKLLRVNQAMLVFASMCLLPISVHTFEMQVACQIAIMRSNIFVARAEPFLAGTCMCRGNHHL